jgi:cellulose 1,4-beta-cellobiosidase
LTSGGPYTTIASGVAATSYQDGGLTNGVTYFYVVSAVNSAGESPNSAERSATPVAGGGGGIPAPPTGVTAVTGSIVGTVDLSWNASASATKYRVKRSRTSGGPYKGRQRVTTLNYTDTGISGRRYYYVITAINALGESGPSTEVTAVAR